MTLNLHGIVTPVVGGVFGETVGDVLISTGYTTDVAGERTPSFDTQTDVRMRVQSLTGPELRHFDGLDVQGVRRGVYLYGSIEAVARPRGKGGDMLRFNGSTWLVVSVLEAWPDWCKVAVVEQMPDG